HGALKNWVRLQSEMECFYFVADWHALTTHYESPEVIQKNIREMVIDWLAAGIDPERSVLFVQSQVPQHAELHLLLSMCTPLSWLERVPTYKDQQANLSDKDLATYGFLGYPLLQAADILIYAASWVPVGEDQVPHVELTREVARRFNHLFGREADFEQNIGQCLAALSDFEGEALKQARTAWLESGDLAARDAARLRLQQLAIEPAQRQRLAGWLEGGGRQWLLEPQPLLTQASRLPGLDGRKMSKSYANAIAMRDDPAQLESKIRKMPTDPARIRRHDPGDPERCPVWDLHKVYCDQQTQHWVQAGCKSAAIGCIDCKKPVIEAVLQEQALFHQRAEPFVKQPQRVDDMLHEGSKRASQAAEQTMVQVREAMGLLPRWS
ncbi:MAG: tryptophan--tRNA ligase, partial [Betaproteobacteria bacterium]|nr:tryptophan--tRNA ligase [Betaproteobacteria bacterium]